MWLIRENYILKMFIKQMCTQKQSNRVSNVNIEGTRTRLNIFFCINYKNKHSCLKTGPIHLFNFKLFLMDLLSFIFPVKPVKKKT